MASVNSIKPCVNLFVQKAGASLVQKPDIVTILKQDLNKLKPAIDTFEYSNLKRVSPSEVKTLFPKGEIEADCIVNEMRKIKRELFFSSLTSIKDFKTWLHSANLSKVLKEDDFREIAEFMNLHKGKYIDVWKGYSKKDNIANIHKLALFVRSISRIDKLKFYKSLSEKEWEVCIDGIVNRPEEVIRPLMKYKFNSDKINNGISNGTKSPTIKEYIERIEKFLDTQKIKYDVKAYRGENSYWPFATIKTQDNKTLLKEIEEFTEGIEAGKYSVKDINKFVDKYLVDARVPQKRFLSTAIEPEAGERYAKKILWYLDIPKGTKGSMIECYNVERASEAELLLQRNSNLRIDDAQYDKSKHIWKLWATVLQQGLKTAD